MSDGTTVTVSLGVLFTLGSIIYWFAIKYSTKADVRSSIDGLKEHTQEREKDLRIDLQAMSARCDRLEASLTSIDKTNAVMTEQLRQLTQAVSKLDATLETLNRHIMYQGGRE